MKKILLSSKKYPIKLMILIYVILILSLCGCSKPNVFKVDKTDINIETIVGNKNLGALAYEFEGNIYYNHSSHNSDGKKLQYTVEDRYVDQSGIYEVKNGSVFKYDLEGNHQTSSWAPYFTVQGIRMIGNNLVRVNPSNESVTSKMILKEDVTYLVRDESQYYFKYKDKLYTLSLDGGELNQLSLESFDGMYVPSADGIYYVNKGQLYLEENSLEIQTTKFNIAFGGIFYLTSDALIFRKNGIDEVVKEGHFETFSIGKKYICVLDSEGVKLIMLEDFE